MAKAQVFSLDVIIGAGVLLALFTVYFISLSDFSLRATAFESYRSAKLAALEASKALAESPGESAAWHALAQANASTIHSIGLTGQARLMENEKLARFSATDYNESKELLGLSGFEFRLSLYSPNRTLLYSAGLEPQPEIQTIVVERIVLLNNSPAKLKLEVWK